MAEPMAKVAAVARRAPAWTWSRAGMSPFANPTCALAHSICLPMIASALFSANQDTASDGGGLRNVTDFGELR